MVRLKVVVYDKGNIYVYQFQFLMVRLKAGWHFGLPIDKWISIPYGSIKRLIRNVISSRGLNKFQFLMVRLKERGV